MTVRIVDKFRKHIKFYVQRPTGYMSSYYFMGAMRDARLGKKYRGSRDPIYITLFGHGPYRLPAIWGEVTPRKVRCAAITKSGERCKLWVHPPEKMCWVHKETVRA